ncbi:hypothetical protein PHK61_21055 [Actinomycetospora lutea]|uniref:hypothetical protein n=1 Tax=Actinomycetospora lutea TaxID=663604 RepID=UPI002366BA2D|nr:hypothetical protein [Actinomycetospora lutea]MDD7940913.1 hypothetical protein [Actinomycetospora lutea]
MLLNSRIDAELLRITADAVLRNLDRLAGEGLRRDGVEQVTAHALALTSDVLDLDDRPDRQRLHGRGLWELLEVLRGPVSTTLLSRLDEALGDAP